MGVFVTSCYSVLIVMSNIEAKAQSNLLPPGFDVTSLDDFEIADREYGSKIVIVVEQMQIAVIWACKACLLILYYRLTRMVASKENVAIKLLAAYVALGFVVMEILYFAAWCRPFRQYWAVPASSPQCSALIDHRITNAIFNISSDLIMLCIALPMFIRSFLPLKRKLILCCIFSLGFFVILASVLNKYYSFSKPYEPTWITWYIRESSTAILVANLPFTWTLIKKLSRAGDFDEQHPLPSTYHSSRTAGGRRTARARAQHSVGTASAEKHTHHTASTVSRNSRSMSLIGSMCAPKEEKQGPLSDQSQHSENGLLHEAPRCLDRGPTLNVIKADDDTTVDDAADIDRDLDIERAASPLYQSIRDFAPRTASPLTSRPNSIYHPSSRPTSPAPSQRLRSPRLSADGTGGFHLASPRRAYLPGTNPRSRTSSLASAGRRPLSPSPSLRSYTTTSTTTTATTTTKGNPGDAKAGGAGGGRSARDRKMRARMST